MADRPPLDLDRVDLSMIAEALQDQSYDNSWWLDPATGEVEPWMRDLGDEEDHPEERGLIFIEPIPSREWYLDMEDFIEHVRDERAADLLARAIAGRGAFRRFKDTLMEFPDLREEWFAFSNRRAERRAIWWLHDHGLIEDAAADVALAAREDPLAERPFEPDAVAREVGAELRRLYRKRLRRLLLVGAWARGDASPTSPVELVAVLDRIESPYAEHLRMDEVLWRASLLHRTVVLVRPVAADALDPPRTAALAELLTDAKDIL